MLLELFIEFFFEATYTFYEVEDYLYNRDLPPLNPSN